MKVHTKHSDKSQYDKAGFLSKLFFIWVTPVFVKAFRRTLLEKEIFNISQFDTTSHLFGIFQNEWENEQRRKKPSLIKCVCRIFWKQYSILGLLLLFENFINLSQPLIIWKLLSFSTTINESLKEVLIYSTLLVLSTVLLVLIRNPYYFLALKMGMRLKIGIGAIVYEKILKLNQKALGQTTSGQIINLMSSDVQKFELSLPHLHYIWIGPLVTIVTILILYMFSREGGLASILVFFILIPAQISLGKLYFKFRFLIASITDERIKMISELINGIQVVKMYCWEPMFIKIIDELRRKTLLYGFLRKSVKCLWVSLRFSGGRFIIISYMCCAFLLEIPLSSRLVWLTVILVNQIRASIVDRFSLGLTHAIDLSATFSRIQKFLSLSEFEMVNISPSVSFISKPLPSDTSQCSSVTFENVFAKWNENMTNEYTLKDISFSLKAPQTCAIIGEIGSGKSSIFMALLGELPLSKGHIMRTGTLSYAAQQPWIFSGSILKNILFNHPLIKTQYEKTIIVTSLDQDIGIMPNRQMTLVGERGVLLSGGQKARISLARAAYLDADIILLDDPLAAVDAVVGYQIFTQCISGMFKHKLVFLVTHQLHLLKCVDMILVLNEGNVLAFGTFDEIISQGVNVQSILKQDTTENIIDKTTKSINLDATVVSEITEDQESNFNNRNSINEQTVPLLFSVITGETTSSLSSVCHLTSEEDELEQISHNDIKLNLYWKYFTVGCSSFAVVMMFLLYVTTMSLYVFTDIWLSWWTTEMDKRNVTDPEFYKNDKPFLMGLIFLTLSTFIGGLLSVICLFVICIYSCKALHEKMLHSIIFSPIKFFNENSAGRILNRFSKDVSVADDLLPITLQDFILTTFLVLFGLGLASYKNYWSILMILFLFIIFWALRRSYMNVSTSVKRIEAVNRSPLFAHISTTLQGLTTIRAFQSQKWFREEFQKKQDRCSKAFFLYISTSRWFAFRLDEVCTVFIITVVYSCVALVYHKKINTSDFGLILTYIIGLIGLTQWAVRQSSEVENQMISIERIYEYITLPSEYPKLASGIDGKLINWPTTGRIEFQNVNLFYKGPEQYVLKNVNIIIEDREKIGIIGRTGAGKSSLISLLFRLVEIPRECGKIIIDHQDIRTLGLKKLRMSLAVIPQDPVLFIGTIRTNLDPFNEFTDNDIHTVLETVELIDAINKLPDKLYSYVSEGGSNLSVGQRQLICMARALLKNSKIIIIDEATANVDPHTDHLIQNTLQTTFAHCTVLTIAHRLNTIMNSDKIIVMNNGNVDQFDHPHVLFNSRTDSIFMQLVQQTGPAEERKLRQMAEKNFLKLRFK